MKQAMSCGCASNAALASARASCLGGFDLGPVGLQGEVHSGRGDPWPVELRVAVGLDGIGVGQREGVTAAAVEGVLQVKDAGAQFAAGARPPRCGGTSSRTHT